MIYASNEHFLWCPTGVFFHLLLLSVLIMAFFLSHALRFAKHQKHENDKPCFKVSEILSLVRSDRRGNEAICDLSLYPALMLALLLSLPSWPQILSH